VLAILFGLLALAAMTRRRLPSDPVQALYRSYCNKLARIGIRRAPAEGALTFAKRSAAARQDLKPDIDAVTELYLKLRYAGLSDTGTMHALKRRVAGFQPYTVSSLSLADTER
ncbi:MAG: DUF4129 domain-containing protein, partial [Acidiferrobacterales bacterium]